MRAVTVDIEPTAIIIENVELDPKAHGSCTGELVRCGSDNWTIKQIITHGPAEEIRQRTIDAVGKHNNLLKAQIKMLTEALGANQDTLRRVLAQLDAKEGQ